MVLTVDVVCDGAAHSYEAGAWSDGEKPPFREEYVENIGESDATLAANHPRRLVESENAVEAMTVDKVATSVETRIAVTASQAKWKQGAGFSGLKNLRQLVVPSRPVQVPMDGLRITAP
jgi:hypothetical protein